MLPIHAAGYHDDRSGRTAVDRVVSSYIPTIKALVYARERLKQTSHPKELRALLIGMPKTAEQNDLPYVEEEILGLEELFRRTPTNVTTTVVKRPTRINVLSTLAEYQIAHFACHGFSASGPAQSMLLLTDWKTVPLTVLDLTVLNIQTSLFAYLSACHTAVSRDRRLLDESINLSTALQLAGYPSVVGTLWQVQDRESFRIAKCVYEWMLEDGERLIVERAAEKVCTEQREI